MDIITEKFYYSDDREYWNEQLEISKEYLMLQSEALQDVPKEDCQHLMQELDKSISEVLSQLLPLPDKLCTIVDPAKYNTFCSLVNACNLFAKDRRLNLMIHTEGMTGCISFVSEELTCYPDSKEILIQLCNAADEIHIAPSVDAGEGRSTDIDNGVRIEFWFDFFQQAEI